MKCVIEKFLKYNVKISDLNVGDYFLNPSDKNILYRVKEIRSNILSDVYIIGHTDYTKPNTYNCLISPQVDYCLNQDLIHVSLKKNEKLIQFKDARINELLVYNTVMGYEIGYKIEDKEPKEWNETNIVCIGQYRDDKLEPSMNSFRTQNMNTPCCISDEAYCYYLTDVSDFNNLIFKDNKLEEVDL